MPMKSETPVKSFLKYRSQGIALVTVLWVIVLLALLATAISTSSRSTGQLTSNIRYASQGKYAAEAGVQWAYWGLLAPADQVSWLADGSIHEMFLADMLVQVAVVDENGKIDLNMATEEMLRALLVAAEVDEERIDSLVDAILDWRDDDDLVRLNGAEDDDYLQAGLAWGARDGPFQSIYELKQVMGMDEQVFIDIRNSVTVYSGKVTVNPLVAPKLVLIALSEMDEDQAEQHVGGARDAVARQLDRGLEARLNRAVFYQLVDMADEIMEPETGKVRIGVYSHNKFFEIGTLEEADQ